MFTYPNSNIISLEFAEELGVGLVLVHKHGYIAAPQRGRHVFTSSHPRDREDKADEDTYQLDNVCKRHRVQSCNVPIYRDKLKLRHSNRTF